MMDEVPRPIRLPGQPDPPRVPPASRRPDRPEVVDVDETYGAEAAAWQLSERLARVAPGAARRRRTAVSSCRRPSSPAAIGIEGSPSAPATLVVFGAHGVRAQPPRKL
jgi:hypothetical protein